MEKINPHSSSPDTIRQITVAQSFKTKTPIYVWSCNGTTQELAQFQRDANNLITTVWTRYGQWMLAPGLVYDQNWECLIQRDLPHWHVDSKNTDWMSAHRSVASRRSLHWFKSITDSFLDVMWRIRKYIVQYQKEQWLRHKYIGHTPVFYLHEDDSSSTDSSVWESTSDNTQKSLCRRYQDILRSFYNLAGPMRMEIFELNQQSNTLLMTRRGKQYLCDLFVLIVEELRSDKNRSLRFEQLFPWNQYQRVFAGIDLHNPDSLTATDIARIVDFLLYKQEADVKSDIRRKNILLAWYKSFKDQRDKSSSKIYSKLVTMLPDLAGVYYRVDDRITRPKRLADARRANTWVAMDIAVAIMYLHQLYDFKLADDVVKMYDRSVLCNEDQEFLDILSQYWCPPVHIQLRSKDIVSAAIKCLRTSTTISLNDLIWCKVYLWDNNLDETTKATLYAKIYEYIMHKLQGILKDHYHTLSRWHTKRLDDVTVIKELFANKWEVTDSWEAQFLKYLNREWHDIQPRSTKKTTWSNWWYQDCKVQASIAYGSGDTTPSDLNEAGSSSTNHTPRPRPHLPIEVMFQTVLPNEWGLALHSNLDRQKYLETECRERTHTTLGRCVKATEQMILHEIYDSHQKLRHYQRLYQEYPDNTVYASLIQKTRAQALFATDTRTYNFLDREQRFEPTHIASVHRDMVVDIACYMLQHELSENRFMRYVQSWNENRDWAPSLYKQEALHWQRISALDVRSCFGDDGSIVHDVGLVSNNIRHQIISGHVPLDAKIWIQIGSEVVFFLVHELQELMIDKNFFEKNTDDASSRFRTELPLEHQRMIRNIFPLQKDLSKTELCRILQQ